MRKIIEFLISRPKVVHLILLFVFILGGTSLYKMNRTGYPAVDFGMIIISTVYPGASAEDIELKITNKIEEKLSNLSDIKRVSSSSVENLSQVSVEMEDVADPEKAEADIQKLMDQITDFPTDLPKRPAVEKVDNERIPVVDIAISSKTNDYDAMYKAALALEDELLQLREVSKVIITGLNEREIHVLVDYKKLTQYQLSFQDISVAIRQQNSRQAGGDIKTEFEKKIVIRSDFKSISDIENVVIRSGFQNNRILLKDVATIKETFKIPEKIFRYNSKPAIQLSVLKKSEQDILDTTKVVNTLLPQFSARFSSVQVQTVTDYSVDVVALLDLVKSNAISGLFLVLFFLMIFLERRIAFWTAMGIPTAIFLAFFFLPMFDVNINFISLMGIILVLGMLVDDAIVVSENIYKYREKGMDPKQASIEGTVEVMWPVIATVATTIVAFMPLMFMSGVMGKFMIQMPIVISFILLASLVEALFILPAHLADSKLAQKPDIRNKLFNRLENSYKRATQYLLNSYKSAIIIGFLVLFAFSIFILVTKMQFILFSNDDGLYGTIEFETEVGTPLTTTGELAKKIEAIVDKMPKQEISGYVTTIGEQKAPIATQGTNTNHSAVGNVFVYLTPFKERDRNAKQIMDDLETRVKHLPGFTRLIVSPMQDGPPVGKPVTITTISSNDKERTDATNELFNFITKQKGVINPETSEGRGKKRVSVQIDHLNAARQGIPVPSIIDSVRTFYQGSTISDVRWYDEEIDITLSVPEKDKTNFSNVRSLLVQNKQGQYIPINNLVQSKEDNDILKISHYNKLRSVTLYADVDTDITTAVEVNKAIRDFTIEQQKRYPSLNYEFGGEERDTQEAMQSLGIAMIVALIGIYSILVILFNSFTQPIVVMSSIPFTLPGIIFAFYMHSEPFGFTAIIGLIGLTGIVVNNSLIMIESINIEVEKSGFNTEAIADGTAKRLRPIILTSVTTAAGLFPTVYGFGGDNAFIIPMLMAVAWGLTFASVVTLFLTPSLYVLHAKIFRRKEFKELGTVAKESSN
jgi:multidrug efflux pump subunit AcrB